VLAGGLSFGDNMTNPVEDRRLRDRLRKALDEIIQERDYQLQRWSEDHDEKHSSNEWLAILTVYLGKAAQCVYPYASADDQSSRAQFRKRVTQLGAVCAAILEVLSQEDDANTAG
jgi:membrane-anchored protein YejM (alkaline phosphatase superfamily)